MGPFDRGGAHALPRNPGRVVLNRLEIFRARRVKTKAAPELPRASISDMITGEFR